MRVGLGFGLGVREGPAGSCGGIDRRFGFSEVAFADAGAVEGALFKLGIGGIRLRLGAEVVFHVDPGVAGLVAQRAARIVAAVDHAVFAARIARDAVHHPVFLPLHGPEHLAVGRIVAVGHQVARRFPALDVVGRDGPGGAGQLAFTGKEFLVNRRAEDGEHLAPFLDLGEFLPRHVARQEELLWISAEALDHVLFGGVVVVARGNRVAIDVERAEELEHVLDLLHVGFLVDGRVGRGLVAENLRHLDGGDAFLEDTLALNDEVVREFEAVHVDVPIHPLARLDDDLGLRGGVGGADGVGFLLGDELFGDELLELRLQLWRENGGQIFPHLLPHEHGVRADVDNALLLAQADDQFLDLRVNQWFAAADGYHRRVAILCGREALLERHHVLQRCGILADAAAAGAGEVAGVQRLKLQDHGELWGLAELMLDDVTGDFDRQC